MHVDNLTRTLVRRLADHRSQAREITLAREALRNVFFASRNFHQVDAVLMELAAEHNRTAQTILANLVNTFPGFLATDEGVDHE